MLRKTLVRTDLRFKKAEIIIVPRASSFSVCLMDKLKIGDIFEDKFQIVQVLGSGGVGTVYKAIQLDCNRMVALKLLHTGAIEDSEYRARFMQEAQALSRLSHANIVSVYHMGITPSCIPYLAMEYLEGQSLRSALNNLNRLPVHQALRIARDTARALAYAHSQGVIHRDLKPENLILVNLPEPDFVKLVDFGLAKLSAHESDVQKLTFTGELIGTSAYMSPEQCMGKPVDLKTDVYSLSVCLYEMTVGQKPMDADTNIGVMYKHINEPVPEIRPGQVDYFDPALNEIIAKGMAKMSGDRFQNMQELIDEINKLLSNLSNVAKKRTRRDRALTLSICAVITIIVLGIGSGLSRILQHTGKAENTNAASINFNQDRASHQAERLKERLLRFQGADALQTTMQKERYLSDLLALAGAQMRSTKPGNYLEAEKTYDQALSFSASDKKRFARQNTASLALKAKAELMQDKIALADANFTEALLLASGNQDYELLSDILGERILLRFRTRNFAGATEDILKIKGLFPYIPKDGPLGTMNTEQVLDKNGESRLDKIMRVISVFGRLQPRSQEEVVQMLEFSIAFTESALTIHIPDEASAGLRVSQSLLARLKDHQDLRQKVSDQSVRCAEISRYPRQRRPSFQSNPGS